MVNNLCLGGKEETGGRIICSGFLHQVKKRTTHSTSHVQGCGLVIGFDPIQTPALLLRLNLDPVKMASTTTGMTPEQAQAALRTLLEGPAMSPPAGVIPNFHNPPNLDVFVTLTIALCVVFGTLAVLLRMYTKVFILRALAWEDCRFPSSL